ncbi:MAG TPA: alanine--tRNA ligase [Kiritimatiellia bacterium]|nr:alanine--tRNA ligase [Kiritimatiellia bacterium]
MTRPQTAADIRQSFLDFFRDKGHVIVPSSPVVIPTDPTLLFANAGMNQFKEIFLGARESADRRVADTQKCIRVSGKHNDLEEVGIDTYHHTFFEMLGNWSFGDYYKREAISWAWELLTTVWGLPKHRLWATVYKDDDEAEALWKELTDIDPAHILRFGEKDNFWEMGETGPCGPCSEIHVDLTPDGCGPELVNAGSPEVMEIWNLVFIQYNRRADGSLEELPAKHVDTGMGLERVVSVLQGKTSNYDTDLFQPLIQKLSAMSGRPYQGDDAVAMRVIADHIRTLAIAIADGVVPSNESRGYVLRRLLRRAVRYSRRLGLPSPFLGELLPVVETMLGPVFPELLHQRDTIARSLRAEEESFAATLDRGLDLFEDVAASLLAKKDTLFPGDAAFKLYDTYGFPLDLTVLIASEKGLAVDEDRFHECMDAQRDRARAARKAVLLHDQADLVADLVAAGVKSEFTGYDRIQDQAPILHLLATGGPRDQLAEGDEGQILLARTPFYAESGGQLGDKGLLRGPAGEFEVWDTQRPAEGLILHLGKVVSGTLFKGQTVAAEIDADRRRRLAAHHTGTHLLQAALKQAVGPGVKQAGSFVGPERLRFDFNHFEAVHPDQLQTIERQVNAWILANTPLQTYTIPFKDVAGSGITAVFDEKYGDTVRVVDIGGYSRELCGGTHTTATGDLGLFRIIGESSVAAGIRRIEAVCGWAAYDLTRREQETLRHLSHTLNVPPEQLPERIDTLLEHIKQMEKEKRQHARAAATSQTDTLLARRQDLHGIPVLVADAGDLDVDGLRSLHDALRAKAPDTVLLLASRHEGKVSLICAAPDPVVKQGFHAGKIIGPVAKVAGGGGGGKPNKAEAGGRHPEKLQEALDQGAALIEQALKK